jgi:hypothetical protein
MTDVALLRHFITLCELLDTLAPPLTRKRGSGLTEAAASRVTAPLPLLSVDPVDSAMDDLV